MLTHMLTNLNPVPRFKDMMVDFTNVKRDNLILNGNGFMRTTVPQLVPENTYENGTTDSGRISLI